MIKALFSDFSYVILFPKNATYTGGLNKLYSDKNKDKKFVYDNYFAFNLELLKYYSSLRDKIRVSIFTSGSVQNHPTAKSLTDLYVDEVISAQAMPFSKSDSAAYDFLLKNKNLNPIECIFVDDSAVNIEAAESAGLHAIKYKSNEDTIKKIENLLERN